MDRVTFDFENNQVIFETDGQQGTEIDPNLKSKRTAIMQAAGYEEVSASELVEELNKSLQGLLHISDDFSIN